MSGWDAKAWAIHVRPGLGTQIRNATRTRWQVTPSCSIGTIWAWSNKKSISTSIKTSDCGRSADLTCQGFLLASAVKYSYLESNNRLTLLIWSLDALGAQTKVGHFQETTKQRLSWFPETTFWNLGRSSKERQQRIERSVSSRSLEEECAVSPRARVASISISWTNYKQSISWYVFPFLPPTYLVTTINFQNLSHQDEYTVHQLGTFTYSFDT